jgi:hypothetical protein
MKLGAAHNPVLEAALFLGMLQGFSDILEVLARFIVNPPLCVASIVAGKAVTAASSLKWVKQIFAFAQHPQAQIEKPRSMAIQ